jgi:hypothetical protein
MQRMKRPFAGGGEEQTTTVAIGSKKEMNEQVARSSI